VLREIGTAGAANYSEYLGGMPVKYYTRGSFENVDNISGAKMTETILVGRSACQGCVIACGRVVKTGDQPKRKGPEYETVIGFGPNLLNDNLESIVDLGELCDRYGMDTISCANTIGLAFHLFEKGTITEKDTGSLVLKWGDVDTIKQLVNLIGRREGIGDMLAQGSRRFGAHVRAEEEPCRSMGSRWRIMTRAGFRAWRCRTPPARAARVITSPIISSWTGDTRMSVLVLSILIGMHREKKPPTSHVIRIGGLSLIPL
jgi:aldehyde:ferredoxin oxidoreductase